MAAKEVLEKIEEGLNCSICLETYTEPKQLECNHVYCQKCLVPLVVRDQQGELLTCPTCRQVTPIPDRGVAGLQPAFHINRLLEIKNSLQKLQAPIPSTPEGAVGGIDVAAGLSAGHGETTLVQTCSEHAGRELELYCETCEELICYKCAVKGGKHQSHDYDELDVAFDKYKGKITSLLEPLKKQVTTITKTLARLETQCEEICDQRTTTEDNVHAAVRHLREVLDARETELIDRLNRDTESKLKGLATQRDQVETTLAKVNSHIQTMKESFTAVHIGSMLMAKKNTVKQAKALTAPLPYTLMTNLKPNIQVTFSDDAIKTCENYGKLSVDIAIHPCEEPVSSQFGWQKGINPLYLKPKRRSISSSSLFPSRVHRVQENSPVVEVSDPVLTISGLDGPWGVAVNKKGEVLVTELGAHCVSVFSKNGKKLRSFGTYGSGHGELHHPHGIAMDGEGNILVVDSGNNRIQKFTADGQFSNVASGQRMFYPSDIGFAAKYNELYVVDSNSRQVQILDASHLWFCSLLGKKGRKQSFSRPCGVACASSGKVYITDRDYNSVRIFANKELSLSEFSGYGDAKAAIDAPYYIAVDNHNDMVYVTEWGNNRVSIFTSKGDFVSSFGTEGSGPGEFNFPRGIAVDDSGLVYVCDGENNRVQVFSVEYFS